jgi:hypothetical protein
MNSVESILSLTETPMIITNQMSDDELEHEFTLMRIRGKAQEALIHGRITVDDFLDTIAECEIDVDDALEHWTNPDALAG